MKKPENDHYVKIILGLQQYSKKGNKIMKKRMAFTLIELLVVISIIALLLSIMMPSLQKAQNAARNVVCKSNLKQWGVIGQMYTDSYDGHFPQGWYTNDIDNKQLWMSTLRDYYGDISGMRCCPTAKNPEKNGGIFGTWGPWPDYEGTYTTNKDYGSYGINEWIYYNDGNAVGSDAGIGSPALYWGKVGARQANRVPVLMDCGTYEIMPKTTDTPPETEGEYTWGTASYYGEMSRGLLNRHSKQNNILYMDWSVRGTGLKEMWDLKWYRGWKMERPILDWPDWMRGM